MKHNDILRIFQKEREEKMGLGTPRSLKPRIKERVLKETIRVA